MTSQSTSVLWQANPGRQTRFVGSAVYEVLWGGEAGGGKSSALVGAPLRWVSEPDFSALLLRRLSVDLAPLLSKAHRLYPQTGGVWRGSEDAFFWPSGAKIRFGHCQYETDAFKYQGDEFHYLGFDELTHFTLGQFSEICSRLRRNRKELPCFIRATSNPGGIGHDWVYQRWGAWLDPKHPKPAREAEIRYYAPAEGDQGSEREVAADAPFARARTFIKSVRSECTQLQPDYEATLAQLPPIRRNQLKKGDWTAPAGEGKVFKQNWFGIIPERPALVVSRCRYWDRSATVDGDWTVGLRLAKLNNGLFVVEHVYRMRGTPGEVEAAIKQCAKTDGSGCPQILERDPGSAGIAEKRSLSIALNEHIFHWVVPSGDKLTRAGPVSSQAEVGNVVCVNGPWVQDFLDELQKFPNGDHDDQVDGLSGAYNWLTKPSIEDDAEESTFRARSGHRSSRS